LILNSIYVAVRLQQGELAAATVGRERIGGVEGDVSAKPAQRMTQEKLAAGGLGDCGKGSGVDIIRPTKSLAGMAGRRQMGAPVLQAEGGTGAAQQV